MSSIDKINVGGVDFDIASSPTPVMAPVETGTTATQPYAVGDYVIVGSTLHEVTAAIAIGDTFTEGTNISTSTSLGDEIKEVKDDLSNYSVNTPLRNVTYYNGKLYQITSTGQRGNEIKMGMYPDYDNVIHTFNGETTYTVPKDGFLVGAYLPPSGTRPLGINNSYIAPSNVEAYVKKGDVITFPIAIIAPNIGGGYGGLYLVGVLN